MNKRQAMSRRRRAYFSSRKVARSLLVVVAKKHCTPKPNEREQHES